MKKLIAIGGAFCAVCATAVGAGLSDLPVQGGSFETSGNVDYTETDPLKGVVESASADSWLTWTHPSANNEYPWFWMHGVDGNPAELMLRNVALTNNHLKIVVAAGGMRDNAIVAGDGHLVLDNSRLLVEKFWMSYGKAFDTGAAQNVLTRSKLELLNGSVLDTVTFCISDGCSISAEVAGSVTNQLVLGEGSELRYGPDNYGRSLTRFNDASSEIVFAGGRVRRKGTGGYVFTPGGWGSVANAPLLYTVRNEPGCDLIIHTSGEMSLYGRHMASNPTREFFDLNLTSAIRKQGWGRLALNYADGDGASNYSIAFNGLKVDCGVLALTWDRSADDVHPVTVSYNSALDIVGGSIRARFVDPVSGGAGTVTASSRAGTLEIGSGSDESTAVEFSGKLNIVKVGSGSFTAPALGLDAAGVSVDGGSLTLAHSDANAARGYRKYRLRVTAVRSSSAEAILEIGEIAVFNGETDVTASAEVFTDWETLSTGSGNIGATYSNWNNGQEYPFRTVDGNLNTKMCDLRAARDGAWWVGFDFGEPTVLTGYKWSCMETVERQPKSWVFEGSDDGVSWTVLDEVTDYAGDMTAKTWVGNGELFELDSTEHAREGLGAVYVAAGASLDVSGLGPEVHATSVSGDGELVLGSARLVIDVPANATNDFICPPPYTGSLVADTGTLRLSNAFDGKYFRLKITANRSGGEVTELARFHLKAADGSVQNLQLSQNAELAAGTYALGGNYEWGSTGEDASNLFLSDANSNKMCLKNFSPSESNPIIITMRLADGAKPIAGYNMKMPRQDKDEADRPATGWTLEGSSDGETWIVLDSRSVQLTPNSWTWYSATDYRFTDSVRPALGATSTVGVLNGGTLDLSLVPATTISRLRVDMSTTGAISHFNPTASGVLDLVNFTGIDSGDVELPIEVGAFGDDARAALASWSVTADGVSLPKLRVRVSNGGLYVGCRTGLSVIVR